VPICFRQGAPEVSLLESLHKIAGRFLKGSRIRVPSIGFV
jgi:hypothetical protein